MKNTLRALLATATLALAVSSSATAANVTWTGASGGDWSAGSNWSGGAVPGSANTAVFNTGISSVTNSSGTNQSTTGITFDTAAGSITISGTTSLLLTSAGTIQMAATLTGTGLTESVNVPLVISSAAIAATYTIGNNYADNTSILSIGGTITGGTTSTVALTLNGANTGNNTISGNINNGTSSALSITKSGAGTWVLSGNDGYTGTTTVTTGTLSLTGTLSGSSNIIVNNAAATFNESSTGAITTPTGSITQSFGVVNLGGKNTYAGPTAVSGGTFNLTGTINNSAITVSGSGVFNESSTGVIAGSALTKVSAGTLTLNGSNTSSGGVTVSGGQLNIGNAAALGTGTFTLSGGSFDNTSGSAFTLPNNNVQAWSGSFTFVGTKNLDLGGGAVTLGANTALTTTTGTLTEEGAVGGAFNLTKSGTGALNLMGTSSYSGTTTISASGGLLILSGTGGALSSTAAVVIGAGSVFLLDDRNVNGVNAQNSNRLSDSAAISLGNGSQLVYQGTNDSGGSNSLETVGTVTPGGIGTITVASNTSAVGTKLSLSGLTHTATTGGIAFVNGAGLGSGTLATGGIPQLLIGGTVSQVGTTAGGTTGINSSSKNTKIVPYLVGESGILTGQNGTVTGTANTFVTYNATTGVRPLNPTDEFVNNTINATTSGSNTYITAATTSGTTVSINSLVVNGGDVSIANGTTLTDASGALLFVTSNNIKPSGTTGAIAFGNSEGIVTTNAGVNATISANITGTGSLTVYGGSGSSLTLSGSNSYTGNTSVTPGATILVGSNNALGTSQLWEAGGTIKADNQARTLANTVIAKQQAQLNIGGSNNLTFSGVGGTGLAYSNDTFANVGILYTNTGTTTYTGTFSLNNAASGLNNGSQAFTMGSSSNVVLAGAITDNNSGNVGTSTIGLSITWNGYGSNITFAPTTVNNTFGSANGRLSSNNSNFNAYNTITVGGPGGSGATITPFGLNSWGINGGGNTYLVAATSGQILGNSIIVSGGSGLNFGFAGSNALTLGGTLALSNTLGSSSGVFTNLGTGGFTFGNNVFLNSQTLTILGSGNTTFNSSASITGTATANLGNIVANQTGTLTFASTNSLTGTTILSGGTVVLDYGASSAGATNRLAQGTTATSLQLNGVNLQLNGGSFAQTLGAGGGTTLGGGATNISQTGGGTSTLALGAIARAQGNGGLINFGAGTATTTTSNTSGILGAYATVGGTDWAVGNGSGTAISAFTGYTALPTTTTSSSTNYNLTASGSSTTGQAESVNTLKLAPTGTGTLTLGGTFSFTSNGGLLFNGSNNYTITGSAIQNGNANSDFIVQQYGTGVLTISSVIANAGGSGAFTLGGTGTVVLSGANIFSGSFIDGGTLQVAADTNLGLAAGSVTLNGGTLETTSGFSTSRNVSLAANGGTIQVDSGTVTIGGVVSGTSYSGITKSGSGTLVLSGSNTYTGATNVNAGTLQLGNNLGLGASAIAGSRSTSPVFINGGTLDINGKAAAVGNLTLSGTGNISDSAGGGSLAAYSFNLQSGSVGAVLTDLVLAGASSNSTNLYKSTTGTVVLTGANNYSGETLISDGTLQVGNGGATGQLGTANVTMTGTTSVLAFNRNNTYTVANAITGSGGVNQTGTGTTVLTNTNTYTGATNITAGKLVVNGSLGASTVNVGNGSAVATLGGAGTVSGSIVTTTVGGNVAHVAPGSTTGAVGTLTVGNLGFTVGNGTAFDFDLNSATTIGGSTNDLIAMGGGVLTFGGTTVFNFNALTALSSGGTYTLISGATSISGFNSANFSTTGTGSLTAFFTSTGTALQVSFSAVVITPTVAYYNGLGSDLNAAGNFDTTVSGTVLTAATATGTTNVYFSANRNTLTAASTSSALSVNSLNFGVGSGTNSGITLSGTSAITITGSNVNGTTGNQGITTTGTGSDSISAPLVLAANQTWSVDTGGTLTVSGTVSGGSSALTKAGAGKLVLSGNNTYSGGTTLSTGTLVLGTSTAGSTTITSGPVGTGTLTLASGSTLQDNGTAITLANAVSVSGTITFSSTGAGSLTFDGRNLTTPSVFTLTGNTILIVNNTTTIDDNIAGNFTLTKQGNGTLNLLGTSSSTAGTTITSGSITIANGASLGSGLISLANGTGLTYTGGAGTLNQNITVASGATGTVSNTGTATLTLAGTLTKADANLILNAGGHTIDVTGAIVSTGATGTFDSDLYVTNGTTIADNSNNSYSGATHIYGNGTLVNGFNNALPTSTVIELGNSGGAATETGASYTNIYQLNGHNQSIAGLTSANPAGFTDSNHVIGGSATLSTLTLTGTASLGEGILGGTGSNANNLAVKFNPGSGKTITLSGSNTYTGGTEVVDGNLLVNNTTGSATGGGTFKLDSGAGLSGTGTITSTSNTINGNVTVGSGGTNTTDVLTMTASGTTTFSGANLTFNLDANSTNSNVLALGSTPSIYFGSGVTTLTLNLLGTGSTNIANGTDYILFTASSASDYKDLTFSGSKITNFVLTLTGTASNGAANSLYYGQSYLILSGNNIEIQVVPEPGTWALMLGGLALLVAFQRIRRSRNS